MTTTFPRITDRSNLPPSSSPETDSLDWKREADPKNPQELAKDMAAMANASGGSLVIGVKEGSVSVPAAIQPLNYDQAKALSTAYEHAARDRISPPAKIDVHIIELDHDGSGQFVLAVNIHPSEAIFCGIKAAVEGSKQGQVTTWQIPKRVASQTKYLNPEEAQSATVERLRRATQRTLSLIENWQDDLSRKETVRRFEDFMTHESNHNIRFPELTTERNPIGLEYTIRPARDLTGAPLSDRREAPNRWLVQVIGPASESAMSADELDEYNDSPIRDGEYYYCAFYEDQWHLSADGWNNNHPFYLSLSEKVGRAEYLESANSVVRRNTPEGASPPVQAFQCRLDAQGMRSTSGNLFSVFRNDTGRLFLRINDSPPKSICFTTPKDTYTDSDWYFDIKNLRGYGGREVEKNIRDAIRTELEQRGIDVPRIPWYKYV